jgi:hypothetical protein
MTVSQNPEKRARNAVKCTALVDETERQIIVCDSRLEAKQKQRQMWMATDHEVRVVDRINVDVFCDKLGYDLVGNIEVL